MLFRHIGTVAPRLILGPCTKNQRSYHQLIHRFYGYKYSGHYTNIKIVDPNLERYSPLILVTRKGQNRFSTLNNLKGSFPLRIVALTAFSLVLTKLCFTEKETWESYKVANQIFYYIFKPLMTVIAFTLNLNVEGEKIQVPDTMAYHRDKDCEVVTNLDFIKFATEAAAAAETPAAKSSAATDSDDQVTPIQPVVAD